MANSHRGGKSRITATSYEGKRDAGEKISVVVVPDADTEEEED